VALPVDVDGSVASSHSLVGCHPNVAGSPIRPVRACHTNHLAAASLVGNNVASSSSNELTIASVAQHRNLRGPLVVGHAGAAVSVNESQAEGRACLALLPAAGVGPMENMMDVRVTSIPRAGESAESVELPLGVLPLLDGASIGAVQLELGIGNSCSVLVGMEEADGNAVDGGVDASSNHSNPPVEERSPIEEPGNALIGLSGDSSLPNVGIGLNEPSGAALESHDGCGLEWGASKEIHAQWESDFLDDISNDKK